MTDPTNPPERRCDTCRFWRRRTAVTGPHAGKALRGGSCYRFPPTGKPAKAPVTTGDQWCYEWKAKDKADG